MVYGMVSYLLWVVVVLFSGKADFVTPGWTKRDNVIVKASEHQANMTGVAVDVSTFVRPTLLNIETIDSCLICGHFTVLDLKGLEVVILF